MDVSQRLLEPYTGVMMRRLVLTGLSAVMLVLAPSAVAQRGNAPPGNAGIDEYVESIPGAGGNQLPFGGDGGSEGAGGPRTRGSRRGDPSPIGESAAELRSLGRDGEAAAALALETAPRDLRARRRQGEDGRSGEEEKGLGGPSGLARAMTGGADGGLGLLLPVTLAAALLCAIAARLVRRRRGFASS